MTGNGASRASGGPTEVKPRLTKEEEDAGLTLGLAFSRTANRLASEGLLGGIPANRALVLAIGLVAAALYGEPAIPGADAAARLGAQRDAFERAVAHGAFLGAGGSQ